MNKTAREDDWRGRPWRERILRAWPATLSAGLLLLAFAPFNLSFLVFVALVPWLISLKSSTGREAWRSGYLFGCVYGLGQLFWVAQLAAHWTHSAVMGFFPWVVSTSLYAIYFGWTAVLIRHCWQRSWAWAIPISWAGIEVFRSFIPTFAFPYGLIANPLWPYPALIQTAHFGTIYLVSAWVLLANVVVVMLVAREPYAKVRTYLAVVLAGVAMSLVVFGMTTPSKDMTVTVAQPGVDLAFGDPATAEDRLRHNIDPITARAEHDGSQLLVLPEGITDVPVMPPHPAFRLSSTLPTIFGGQRGTDPIYQSAFAFDGKRWQFVDKTRLVVFGEFTPGRFLLSAIIAGYHLPTADLSPGRNGVRAVDLAGIRVGPIVCFEALFPDVAYRQSLNDCRLLTVIGIDDWFMDGNAPGQIRAASVWRAIESGLPLVRSTTQGYTLACDGKGRVFAEAPLRTPVGLRVSVPIPIDSPAFHALPVFPVGACLFALALPWLPKARRQGQTEPKG